MRVVFWNIRHGGGVRAAAIARRISTWGADAVALCEFRGTPPSGELARALAARGLAYQCTTADPARPTVNGLLLASRWPLRRVRLATAPVEPGRWLLARIQSPTPLVVGVMHVPNRVTGRKYPYLDAVLETARRTWPGPAVFLGDTNSGRIGLDEEVPAFNRVEDG
ncbi:MAG TPA: endonuclease/exonuclease/phosphatase family protein, partial [Methylomirabilota bacterium]|nr:endonuclease/exonuclease/phosphatase family protein [Methylomirabilota bacterium]